MEFLTPQEIRELINQFRGQSPKTADFEAWSQAFKTYNEDPENAPINMGCPPCYRKVYSYMNKAE